MKTIKIYNEEKQETDTYEISPDSLQLVKDFLSYVDRYSRDKIIA